MDIREEFNLQIAGFSKISPIMQNLLKHLQTNKYLYALVVIIALFLLNILTHLNTATFGKNDLYYSIWIQKFYCDKISTGNLYTDKLFYKEGIDLTNGVEGRLSTTLLCPITTTFGPVTAVNILLILNILLAALVMYAVLCKIGAEKILAFTGALLYIFSNYLLLRIQVHLYLSTIWVYPLLYYYLLYKTQNTRKEWILINTLALASIFLCTQNIAIAGTLYLVGLLRQILLQRKNLKQLVKNYMRGAIVASLLFSPFIYSFIIGVTQIPKDVQQSQQKWAQTRYTNDLGSIIAFPKQAGINKLTNTYSQVNEELMKVKGTNEEEYLSANIGILELILGILTFIYIVTKKQNTNEKDKWLITTALFFLYISFGNKIALFEYTLIPFTGYEWLKIIPLFQVIRTPVRFIILTQMMVIIYITTKNKLPKNNLVRCLLLASLFVYIQLFKYAGIFQPTILPNYPTLNTQIQNNPGVVLNIPINLGAMPEYNLLQMQHNQKIIGGYVTYITQTQEAMKTITTDALLQNLSCDFTLHPYKLDHKDIQEKYPELLTQSGITTHLKTNGIKYVFIHKTELSKEYCTKLNAYTSTYVKESELLKKIFTNEHIDVYQLP
jgi:hypothetical protein